MVGSIYYINMPYSDFKHSKGRPVLALKYIDKNDLLILPLTTNLTRKGIRITNNDIEKGSLKKDSVIIVPKITAIDCSLISETQLIATLTENTFKKVLHSVCHELDC
jgi:mRNA-degrading endonuclease toxin of MazEF toxin-antitoxin module